MRNNKRLPLTVTQVYAFQKKIYDFYEAEGRDLPWRKRPTHYRVLVSEIMLQQTQVDRVTEKYREFLTAFPDFSSLAKAPLPKLLRVWQGMGYNRRALALKALAQQVIGTHRGKLPSDPKELIELPGIGKYTAGAIAAFAFNRPVVFMDTNIRRVFIHEFLHDRESVHDDEIIPLIEQTLDAENPRKWYNALMDYGTMLKQKHVNPNRKSAHYTRQSPFENSNRQVRGKILRALVAESPLSTAQIVKKTGMDPERVKKNIVNLIDEGFIKRKGRVFTV
ncbi:MAG: winged helix-turn-helix transcriptional regulator [Betaproteobacteria bacterium]